MRDHRSRLERSRENKIKTLGYILYNSCVDGAVSFPGADRKVAAIKEITTQMIKSRNSGDTEQSGETEKILSKEIRELGYICYNMVIDGQISSDDILSICDSIGEISRELAESETPYYGGDAPGQLAGAEIPDYDRDISDSYAEAGIPEHDMQHGVDETNGARISENRTGEWNDIKATVFDEIHRPGSQGHISEIDHTPSDSKVCVCGHTNRAAAKFCANCGARLS